jgi:putative ABC transport system substrate-binding protein
MRRREFIGSLIGTPVAWSLAASAQIKLWRIGWLSPFSAPEPGQPYETLDALRNALSELGYVEHRNYVIESRFADTDWDRLPRLAKELVDRGVDVIVTIGTPPVAAAKAATTTIPIVMAGSANPVEHGLSSASHVQAAT